MVALLSDLKYTSFFAIWILSPTPSHNKVACEENTLLPYFA